MPWISGARSGSLCLLLLRVCLHPSIIFSASLPYPLFPAPHRVYRSIPTPLFLIPPPPPLCSSFLFLNCPSGSQKGVKMWMCVCVQPRGILLSHSFLHFPLFDISCIKSLVDLKVKLIHPPIVCLLVLEISERGLNTWVTERMSWAMRFMVGS